MSRSRFVRPELVTLSISDGDTITVKRRLTAGEQREAYARMYQTDGAFRVNPLQSGLALMTAFLVDWTLVDDTGARVPIRGLSVRDLEAVLNSLDTDSFTEIKDAIQAHELAQRDEREAQKKILSGAPSAGPTSPSQSEPDGGSTGSASSTPTTTSLSLAS